jgi:hypothetical protein
VFTELLPTTEDTLIGDTALQWIQIEAHGFMKHAAEIDSGAMVHIPSFVKIGSGNQNFMGRGFTDTHTHRMDIA